MHRKRKSQGKLVAKLFGISRSAQQIRELASVKVCEKSSTDRCLVGNWSVVAQMIVAHSHDYQRTAADEELRVLECNRGRSP